MNIFDNLGDLFKGITDLYTKSSQLAAIWLTSPLQTENERTSRITSGQKIRVENSLLIDCSEDKKATHEVIGTLGTLTNQFELVLMNLETGSPETLKI